VALPPQLETADPERATIVLCQFMNVLAQDARVRAGLDAWWERVWARLPPHATAPVAAAALWADLDGDRALVNSLVERDLRLAAYDWLAPVLHFQFYASSLGQEILVSEPQHAVTRAPFERATHYAKRDRVAKNALWRPVGYRAPRNDEADYARDVEWFCAGRIQNPRVEEAELARAWASTHRRHSRSHQTSVHRGITRVERILDGIHLVSHLAPLRPRTGRLLLLLADSH